MPFIWIQNSAVIARAGFEIIQDLLDLVHALRRVAVLHFAPDDGRGAFENTFRRF